MSDTRQQLAVVALAGGAKYPQAADAANVSLRTIKRWASEPEFQRAVADERQRVLDRAAGTIAARYDELVERLLVVALAPGPQSPTERLRAIGMALDRGRDWQMDAEVMRRIALIEERMR